MQALLISICLIGFIGCNSPVTKHSSGPSFRDSVLAEYFSTIDSMQLYHPADDNYGMLKAYFKNDSTHLLNLRNKLERELLERRQTSIADSCITQTDFTELNIDEGYCFRLDDGWVKEKIQIVILNQHDKFKLQFTKWIPAFDTIPCKKLVQYEKAVSEANWTELKHRIKITDFWSLSGSGPTVLDADHITVTGFKTTNGIRSSRRVTRALGHTHLTEIFEYAWQLTGYKQ